MCEILVVGDAMIDRHWYCNPKYVSPEAPIMTWNVESKEDRPGGAANVLENLLGLSKTSQIKFDPILVSKIFPDLTYCLSNKSSIKFCLVDTIGTIKNRIIVKTPHRQVSRFDEDNIRSLTLTEETYLASLISGFKKNFEIGIVSDYKHGMVTRKILAEVRKKCNIVLIDPKGNNLSKYDSIADVITPNLNELYSLTGGEVSSSIKNRIRKIKEVALKKTGLKTLILKLGSKGCLVYGTKGLEVIPAYTTEKSVVDPMGAGDTFIATLATSLFKGEDIYTAARKANKLAGVSVTFPNCWVPGKNV